MSSPDVDEFPAESSDSGGEPRGREPMHVVAGLALLLIMGFVFLVSILQKALESWGS